MLTRSYQPQTPMVKGRPPPKPYSLETRSSLGTYNQVLSSHGGLDPTPSSSPPQLQQNCWGISPGYTSITLSGRQNQMIGPPRWWAQPNFGWYVLLILVLLHPLVWATECNRCMHGSGQRRYFQSYTYMPKICYEGKTPITCTSTHAPGKTFWASELNAQRTTKSPCNQYPKTGTVCWTYLAQIGLSDGGGVQDQAKHHQTKQMLQNLHTQRQAQTTPTYRGLNLDTLQNFLPTDQLTNTLINSSYNLWQNLTGDRDCWVCFPFSTITNIIGIPIPTTWRLPNITTTNQTVHTGALGKPIPIYNLSSTQDILTFNASSASSSLPYCTPPGIFLSCPEGIYRCLTASDSLNCIFILLSPSTNIYSHTQLLSLLFPTHRAKRAVFVPLLIGAGLATGIATGVAGLGTSINFYYKLSQALNEDMERIADSLTALQTQITSLAAIALQNRRALDLLTAEKGGTCLYLKEECCYYVNQSGIVTSKVRELRDRIQARRQDSHIWGLDPHAWVTWLLPLAGPLCLILLSISVAPCLIRYLWERLQEMSRVSVNQLLLQPYSRLPTSDYPYNDAHPSAGSSRN
ncbi:syncytin-1-like [Crocuta crocuta]